MGSIPLSPSAVTPPEQARPCEPASLAGMSPALTVPDKPTVVVRPRRGWQPVHLGELWRFRDLLWILTLRDVSVRYKQTVLGVLWAVLRPVMSMVVFTVFFGWVMGAADNSRFAGKLVPYPVYVLSGQIFWEFFSSAVSASSNSLVTNARLLQKVYLPRLVLPISAVGAPAVDFVVAFGVLVVMMIVYGLAFSPDMLLLPRFIVSVLLAALGVGIGLSALAVAYRDFRFVVPFLVSTWFFATPVVWQMDRVATFLEKRELSPDLQWLMYLNPMVGPVEAFRAALLGAPINATGWAISTAVALVCCVIGLFYFARVERQFADLA